MPKANKQHIRRALSHKRRRRHNPSAHSLYIGITLIIVVLGVSWILSRANPLSNGVQLDTHYEVTGSPTISADFINQVLDEL